MQAICAGLLMLAVGGLSSAQTVRDIGRSRSAPQHSPQTDNSDDHLDNPNWLSPFVATPVPVVDAALALAGVGANDLVYDLGSGNGRIILAAAQNFQARAVGIEWDQALCEETSSAIKRLGLEERVRVIQGDIFAQDLSPATVVTGYLMPKAWERLAPILERQLKKGARVVSINDPIPGWQVVEKQQLRGEPGISDWILHLYQIR